MQLQYQLSLLNDELMELTYYRCDPNKRQELILFLQQKVTPSHLSSYSYSNEDEYIVCISVKAGQDVELLIIEHFTDVAACFVIRSDGEKRFIDVYNRYLDELELYWLHFEQREHE